MKLGWDTHFRGDAAPRISSLHRLQSRTLLSVLSDPAGERRAGRLPATSYNHGPFLGLSLPTGKMEIIIVPLLGGCNEMQGGRLRGGASTWLLSEVAAQHWACRAVCCVIVKNMLSFPLL